jgi:basic membrane protein A
MKKLLLVVTALFLVLGLSACDGAATDENALPDPNEGATSFEIALVTDVGTIDDGSFNQGAWEGLVLFAVEHQYTHKYYQPVAKSTDDYVDAIELAIANGARTVVCPGFLFENAVWAVQGDYPNVNFIILDGSPHNVTDWDTMATYGGGDVDFTVMENVRPIFYTEHESGFLAGYAAVADGNTKLGFVGGMAVPAVVRFGYGFVQGANQAAVDMALADGAISINYWYSNVFWETSEVQSTAAAWYTGGTEVIFAAAGGAGFSVMTAADQEEGLVIGVDVDQSAASDSVITSAKKELAVSVYDTLVEIYGGTGVGYTATFDVHNDGVGLPQDFSRFTTFDQAAYDAIYAKLVAGTIVVDGDNTQTLAVVAAKYAKVVVSDEN